MAHIKAYFMGGFACQKLEDPQSFTIWWRNFQVKILSGVEQCGWRCWCWRALEEVIVP